MPTMGCNVPGKRFQAARQQFITLQLSKHAHLLLTLHRQVMWMMKLGCRRSARGTAELLWHYTSTMHHAASANLCSPLYDFEHFAQTREVDNDTGLKMVRAAEGSADLLWRYLDYLVCQQGSTQPALHTELALTLVDVTLKLLPKPDGATML